MKFRKKPVVIDAFQWTGDFDALDAWLNSLGYQEDGEDGGAADGIHESDSEEGVLIIPADEGEHRCQRSDWVVRGVQGEFYSIKADVLALTYEPAPAAQEESTNTDEEYRHPFRPRPLAPEWCQDCEFHQDNEMHAPAAQEPQG